MRLCQGPCIHVLLKYSNQLSFGNSITDSGFYFTEGRKKTKLDRSLLAKKDPEIARYIRFKVSYHFMNNGKSDIIVRPKEPTPYDILACLTKYDPETFEDFCSEFGYDTDSRSAKKTYKAVVKEWNGIVSLFDDNELELLREIN